MSEECETLVGEWSEHSCRDAMLVGCTTFDLYGQLYADSDHCGGSNMGSMLWCCCAWPLSPISAVLGYLVDPRSWFDYWLAPCCAVHTTFRVQASQLTPTPGLYRRV